MKRSRAVAKLAWKALKNDPESSKAAVSAAKAAYKRLKRTPANVVQRDWPLTTAAAFSDAAIDASFEGSLLLKTRKGKWQVRFFQTHGGYLFYSRKKGGKVLGGIDLAGNETSIAAGHDSLRVVGLDRDAHDAEEEEEEAGDAAASKLRTMDLRYNDGPSLYDWHGALLASIARLEGAPSPPSQSAPSVEVEPAKQERRPSTTTHSAAGDVSTAAAPAESTGEQKQKAPALSAAAVAYLAANEIVVHQRDAPPPCLALSDAPFPAPLVRLLRAQAGFTTPSPVQAATWPIAVSGRDVLAIAKTGSGKTLGFLLPVLARCDALAASSGARGAGPIALIMAPTRELALQIHAVAVKFGAPLHLRSVAVYGGAKKAPQLAGLARGCELVIGTPGRIKDCMDLRGDGPWGGDATCRAERLALLVLDEADRMLDMGFERDIHDIVWAGFGKRPRQTFFYSATWPPAVEEVAQGLLAPNHVKVTVGKGGRRLTASKSVVQRVFVVGTSSAPATTKEKMAKFKELMAPFFRRGADVGKRVIIFANRKTTVNKLAKWIKQQGLACDVLSGDRKQSQRESTLRRFRSGTVTAVVATDVASRGLDVKGIQCVINYELPAEDFENYVHRIGRTGRAGETGRADSIFTDKDMPNSVALVKLMKDAGQSVPEGLARCAPRKTTFAD